MLDRMIARSELDSVQVERLGERLASFYAAQPAVKVTPEDYLGRFLREQASNRTVLHACPHPTAHDRLLDRLDRALAERRTLLKERARAGRILDGHGDLRPEHVCMNDPIVIYDCLEFSEELRQLDPVDELGFFGMECGMLGAAWVGPKLIARVLALLGQSVPDELIALYTAYRALLRVRLTLAHLLDRAPRTPEKWAPLAERYAAAADEALLKLGL
jgi:aminoglycoside phosphotransferase family enzyme